MNDTSESLLLCLMLMFYECDTGGNDTDASDAMRALYEMLSDTDVEYFDDAHFQVHGCTLDQAGEPVPEDFDWRELALPPVFVPARGATTHDCGEQVPQGACNDRR